MSRVLSTTGGGRWCSRRPLLLPQPLAAPPPPLLLSRRRALGDRCGELGSCGGRTRLRLPEFRRPSSSLDGSGDMMTRGVPSGNEESNTDGGVTVLHRDRIKEDSRKYRRTVFDFDSWREHRSVDRYARHAFGMWNSRVVRGLLPPLSYIFSLGLCVATYCTLVEAGLVPGIYEAFRISHNGPYGLTSFALSLLLVFRTNASYSRWLDARKTWGLIVNRTRDMVRQAIAYFPSEDRDLLDLWCRWTLAYTRALVCHITEGHEPAEEFAKVLPPHEVEALMAVKHRPNYCLQVLSEVLSVAQLPTAGSSSSGNGSSGKGGSAVGPEAVLASAVFRMDQNLTVMEDTCGTCERILRSPIPLSYTRHTSRFMMIWLTLLPFSLWESCHWAMVPMCCIIAFLLLGIEEIGVTIEEPFSILPLDQLCDTMQTNVQELCAVHAAQSDGASNGNGSGADGQPQTKSAKQIVHGARLESAAALSKAHM